MTKYLTEISGYTLETFEHGVVPELYLQKIKHRKVTRNGARSSDYTTKRLFCAVYLIISSRITARGNGNSLFCKILVLQKIAVKIVCYITE